MDAASERPVIAPSSATPGAGLHTPATDTELERKIAKAKRLAEEIERAERLDRLKREQSALEEEIEAAKARQKQAGVIELE